MRKNILFITVDQMRHDALGLRGVFPVKTPNLDELAASGCLFENAYCSNPLCTPSRAGIMTGQQCFQNGVYYNDQNWPPATPTIPGLLSSNGYYSIKIGKTHFLPPKFYGGFDQIIGEYDLTFDEGVAESDKEGWERVIERQYHERKAPTPYDTYEPVVHQRVALRELKKLVERRDCVGRQAVEPFFLWLSMKQPHTPCNPPEPYRSMYDPATMPEAVKSEEEIEKAAPEVKNVLHYWTSIDESLRRGFMARYLGSVTLLDQLVGELLEFLRENQLEENTLVVFTSDHGDYLGDHHKQQKGRFHDCASKVPLIFRGPDVARGRVVSENVSLIDLLPTFLDQAQLLMPDKRDSNGKPIYDQGLDIRGISLLPALDPERKPEGEAGRRVVVSETATHGQGIMLKQGRTKINYYPQSGYWDHFETDTDPHELNNLGGRQKPALTPEMEQTLQEVLEGTARWKDHCYFFEKVRPMFT
jgi:arylsulfatase